VPDTNLLLFVTASLALIVVPGPDMIYVLTRGVSQGRVAGLVSAVGVCSGLQVHTAFAALGLSAILAQSALALQPFSRRSPALADGQHPRGVEPAPRRPRAPVVRRRGRVQTYTCF
jgi:hypothetical protein